MKNRLMPCYSKMDQAFIAATHETIREVNTSDSSTDFSSKNNKARMKEFKTISLQRKSLMDHLFCTCPNQNSKKQSLTLLHSQKWDFDPIVQNNGEKNLSLSRKLSKDNPFYRAKQMLLAKQKASASPASSQKEMSEQSVDIQLEDEKITFRLLKRRSLNLQMLPPDDGVEQPQN